MDTIFQLKHTLSEKKYRHTFMGRGVYCVVVGAGVVVSGNEEVARLAEVADDDEVELEGSAVVVVVVQP